MEKGRFYWSPGKEKRDVPSYYSYRDVFADCDAIIVSQWLERPAGKGGRRYSFWAPKFSVFDKEERDKMYVLEAGCIYMEGFSIRWRRKENKKEKQEKEKIWAVNRNVIHGNPFQGEADCIGCEMGGKPMNSEQIAMHQRKVVESLEYWDLHLSPAMKEGFPTYEDVMEKYIELFIREMKKRRDLSPREKAAFVRYFEDNVPDYERFYHRVFRDRKSLLWVIK